MGVVVFFCLAIPKVFHEISLSLIFIAGGISATGVIIAFSIISETVSQNLKGIAIGTNNTFVVLGAYVGDILFGEIKHVRVTGHWIRIVTEQQQYHFAMLMYPLFSLFALVSVMYSLGYFTRRKI